MTTVIYLGLVRPLTLFLCSDNSCPQISCPGEPASGKRSEHRRLCCLYGQFNAIVSYVTRNILADVARRVSLQNSLSSLCWQTRPCCGRCFQHRSFDNCDLAQRSTKKKGSVCLQLRGGFLCEDVFSSTGRQAHSRHV